MKTRALSRVARLTAAPRKLLSLALAFSLFGCGDDGVAESAPAAVCVIDTPTRWSAGVQALHCNVDVRSTLTIDPGAIVKFGPEFFLDVRPGGVLTAIGTEAQPIVFTSLKDDVHGGDTNQDGPSVASPNDWGCRGACGDLNINGSGSALEWVQDLYGSNGVYVQAEAVEVNHSTFAHHAGYGLVLDGSFGGEMTHLTGNAFFDNGGYPLHLGRVVFLDGSNVFHDPVSPDLKNAKQCVELDTDVDRLTVLGVTELGFLFSGHKIEAELLVPLGTTFKASADSIVLGASGSFVNGQNVTFTSYKDDVLGGDCTGDGPTAPADGDWQGLWIDDGSNADFAARADFIRYAAKFGTMLLH
jgi:hypothetical protein